VRIPKTGTWVLKNIRSGGQGVKRGQLEDLKDGVRQVKEMRKQAREAERQRRYDDGAYSTKPDGLWATNADIALS
jgi:hypothetical protein